MVPAINENSYRPLLLLDMTPETGGKLTAGVSGGCAHFMNDP